MRHGEVKELAGHNVVSGGLGSGWMWYGSRVGGGEEKRADQQLPGKVTSGIVFLWDHCRGRDSRGRRRTRGVWSFMAPREHRWWTPGNVADQDSFLGCPGPRDAHASGEASTQDRAAASWCPSTHYLPLLSRQTKVNAECQSWKGPWALPDTVSLYRLENCCLFNATPQVNGRAKTRTQVHTCQASNLPLASRIHYQPLSFPHKALRLWHLFSVTLESHSYHTSNVQERGMRHRALNMSSPIDTATPRVRWLLSFSPNKSFINWLGKHPFDNNMCLHKRLPTGKLWAEFATEIYQDELTECTLALYFHAMSFPYNMCANKGIHSFILSNSHSQFSSNTQLVLPHHLWRDGRKGVLVYRILWVAMHYIYFTFLK